MTVLTQVVELQWRPALGFFEQRTALLREMEAAEVLNAFHWTVDDVTIRVGDHEALVIGVSGATAYVMSQTDSGRVRQAIERAMVVMQPDAATFVHSRFRTITPIASEPKSAQLAFTKQVSGALAGGRLTDTALLFDGYCDRLNSGFGVEFGVVSQPELDFRLKFDIGRIGPVPAPVAPDTGGLPHCAMFFDWNWPISAACDSTAAFGSVVEIWNALLTETERISTEILDHYLPDLTQQRSVDQA